jgi:hypothetical protein
MANINYTSNGYTVHSPEDWQYHPQTDYSNFMGRRPVLMSGRNIYLGHPGDYHLDAASHHDIPYDAQRDMYQGYFNGGPEWGGGKLEMHNEVHAALNELGHNIPESPPPVSPFQNLGEDENEDWDDDLGMHDHNLGAVQQPQFNRIDVKGRGGGELGGSNPWIYHIPSKTLMVGGDGHMHWDVVNNNPGASMMYGEDHGGPPKHPDFSHGRVYPREGENQFYDTFVPRHPVVPEEDRQLINNALGTTGDRQNPWDSEEDWTD